MKQFIPLDQLTPQERDHITRWRHIKHYDQERDLSLGEILELIIALSYNLHTEWSDGRFFHSILVNEESIVAWEDEELIDGLFYEFQQQFKRRLSLGTFTEEVIS